MHGVLAQHVDAELLAGLGEADEGVEREDICEDARALVVVYEFEEMLSDGHPRVLAKATVDGRFVEVVHAGVLVVKRLGQDEALQARVGEHALRPRLELDISVVELRWHRTPELELVGLEVVRSRLSLFALLLRRLITATRST